MSLQHPYTQLTQDKLIDWLESLDLLTDYHIYPLNSYENRVYRVGIEDGSPIVVKVYRPGRWDRAQIQEELDFTAALHEQELPVVPAIEIQGQTLLERDGFYLACFPLRAGHAFELDNADKLYRIGQLLGRMHSVSLQADFAYRPTYSLQQPLTDSLAFFSNSELIPSDIQNNYIATLEHLNRLIEPFQAQLAAGRSMRLHGDFHAGNILSRDDQLLLVDFDDSQTGPAMQDIWKLLSGSEQEQQLQLAEIGDGYEQFCDFPTSEIPLIEALRTTHMVRHTLWIARRWQDPAFPLAFPWFGSSRYWSEHLLALKEQLANLQDIRTG